MKTLDNPYNTKYATMKNLLFTAGLLATLSGCATSITDTQADCQSSNSTFVGMVACLNGHVSKNPRLLTLAPRAEYMAYANLLAEQVTYGKLNDATARYMLASKLTEAQATYDAQQRADIGQALLYQQAMKPSGPSPLDVYSATMRDHSYRQPTTTTCSPGLAGTIHCTTR